MPYTLELWDASIRASTDTLYPPPPGVQSNLIDPVSRSWAPKVAVYTTLPIMVLAFVLRVYVRLFLSRAWGSDDYFCILAFGAAVAYCGLLLADFNNEQFGRHVWDIPTEYFLLHPTAVTSIIIPGGLLIIGINFTKLTLLVLYLRLFKAVRRLEIWIWVGIAGIIIIALIQAILTLLFCLPRKGDGGWTAAKYSEHCSQPYLRLSASQGIVNAIADFYLLAIPVTTVMGINVSMKRRLAIVGVFLAGLLVTLLTVVGSYYRFESTLTYDSTWVNTWIAPLSVAEMNVGVICACLPMAFTFFKGLPEKTETAWAQMRNYLGSSSEHHVEIGSIHVEAQTKESISRERGRSQWSKTPTERRRSSYVELESIDYDSRSHRADDPLEPDPVLIKRDVAT
ncbi:hypothetical protein F5Y18DRAFT_133894 [Xylariaceae sp. FL1019]|nr:hypothetical protein F5Y18DRAFT_133894 [Xylariaceae sp. FL1019]